MKKIGHMIHAWLVKFWVPLSIVVALVTVAIGTTMVLLHREQVTVKIENIPIHSKKGPTAPTVGVLKPGEHLQILQRTGGWYQVRRENESKAWVAGWLVERSKPLNKLTPLSESTVVLDPGHGGSDSGALSTNNKYEKNYTLALAKRVKKQLEKRGTRVIMTRSTDKLVPLAEIPEIAERNQADLFISFHFDSAPEANSASGYTTYYYHKKNQSKRLAQAINQAISPNMPDDMHNKGVDFGDYLVLRDNSVPAILMENGYINSDRDFKHMQSASYQNKIAKSIPTGLENYLETR
ncbi:N-acetylmuramoyl-L-alanine amidase [Weissella uvarum]|nr:N-acetylmuramoyl-L-alanine amidase [Weissella uvarum]MCM0595907.1 N-acetylmuramoyl-L-alanine amidase [Weissella uvarum]